MANKTAAEAATRPKKSTKKKPAAKKSAVSRAVGGVLASHRGDLLGLGALLLGLLSAASVWLEVAGAVGEGVDSALAAAVGLIRVVVPLGLMSLGFVLLRQKRDPGPTNSKAQVDSEVEWSARLVVGGLLLLGASSGLLHIVRGRPGLDDTIDELGAAGGLLGLGVGGALYASAALVGSVLILGLVSVFGSIVLTGISANELGRRVLALLKPSSRWLKEQIQALFSDVSTAQTTETSPTSTPRYSTSGHTPNAIPAKAIPAPEPDPDPDPEPIPTPTRKPPLSAVHTPKTEPRVVSEPKPPLEAGQWTLPPQTLLARSRKQEVDTAEVAERGQRLQATLAQFGVETEMLEPIVGPTVTRYVLTLGEGVKVTKFESLRKDMALAMASPDVRILAPIPGRRAIGVEVPNNQRDIVTIGDILASPEAQKATHPLEVAIGRDINGHNVIANIATMPHVLIAGATGAGKSSCLNSLLSSILMRSTPEQVRMILVDPKRVEMGQYERIPHLLTAPVTDPRKAANALAWAVREMERRYDILAQVGVRDITGYNQAVDDNTLKPPLGVLDANGERFTYSRLPFVLVVVDELADLMMVAARDVEESIARIAQMARAVGIHLVIATQRPSVNVITGVIKANIPSRWAFAVSSLTDSRVILDQPGAERLVGGGDLLMLGTTSSALNRIQGCWVEEAEVRAIVGHWHDQVEQLKQQTAPLGQTASSAANAPVDFAPVPDQTPNGTLNPGDIIDSPTDSITDASTDSITNALTFNTTSQDTDEDELLGAAMELVVQTQLGSTSMLQRKLRVGFARAGRIMDLLEQQGVVGPSTGSKAREVLVSAEELESRQSNSRQSNSRQPNSANTTTNYTNPPPVDDLEL